MFRVVEQSRGVKCGFKSRRLTVIGKPFKCTSRSGKYSVVCQCECGTITAVDVSNLLNVTESCGCAKGKHKASHKKLYFIWRAMRSRCLHPADHNHTRYALRGITICDEWKDDYSAFERWALANGYQEGLSIDRKNNDGNYCPENCQWLTRGENSRKRGEDHREKKRRSA